MPRLRTPRAAVLPLVALVLSVIPASAQVRLSFDKHPGIQFGDNVTATFRIKSQNDWRVFQPEPGTNPVVVTEEPYAYAAIVPPSGEEGGRSGAANG